jgi:hypothetical protein
MCGGGNLKTKVHKICEFVLYAWNLSSGRVYAVIYDLQLIAVLTWCGKQRASCCYRDLTNKMQGTVSVEGSVSLLIIFKFACRWSRENDETVLHVNKNQSMSLIKMSRNVLIICAALTCVL